MVKDIWELMNYGTLDNSLPHVPCVYFLMNGSELVYIGQTKDLRNRIYFHNWDKTCQFYIGEEPMEDSMIDSVFWLETGRSVDKRLSIEKEMIDQYQPKFNIETKNFVL